MGNMVGEKRGREVAILLGTYQGQRFIEDQLDSLKRQSYSNWCIWASDDGSKDSTTQILERYQGTCSEGRMRIISGPQKGFAANFLHLACHSEITSSFFAFSDQDDIWCDDKLEKAISWLETVEPNVPALYCSRTRLVDEQNNEIGLSPLMSKEPGFANALTQTVGGANTMVFNKAAQSLVMEAGSDLDIVSHDWWLYLVVSGCGGVVHFDEYPSLRYRQHCSNQVGKNTNLKEKFSRVFKLLSGVYKSWNSKNIDCLKSIQHRLTPENQAALSRFSDARKRGVISRLVGIKRSGIYRQSFMGNVALVVAAVLNRI